jgi:hypothetical protein
LAAPTNTLITNNAVGNRESLHNIISILNKDETPFQAAIRSGDRPGGGSSVDLSQGS